MTTASSNSNSETNNNKNKNNDDPAGDDNKEENVNENRVVSHPYHIPKALSTQPSTSPQPAKISLPADQYLHAKANTDWWWHVGTLATADGSRIFGYEINAGKILGAPVPVTELLLTDVTNKVVYRSTNGYQPTSPWAESDPSKPWFVILGNPATSTSSVSMTAIDDNPMNMSVTATFTDINPANPVKKKCVIRLTLKNVNEVPPHALMVGGNGIIANPNGGTSPMNAYNYYYSFTNLAASGTISIEGEPEQVVVQGLTWMDHEYGWFPKKTGSDGGSVTWCLQAVQLTLPGGKFHFSNFTTMGQARKADMSSTATLVDAVSGESVVFKTQTTPSDSFEYTYPATGDKFTYFRKFLITGWQLDQSRKALLGDSADLGDSQISVLVTVLVDNQVLMGPVYEGVAVAEFFYGDTLLAIGTAWAEQQFT
jgi:predicted secreted hydrolase